MKKNNVLLKMDKYNKEKSIQLYKIDSWMMTNMLKKDVKEYLKEKEVRVNK